MYHWTNEYRPGRDRAARVSVIPGRSVRVDILTGSTRDASPMVTVAGLSLAPDIARVLAGELIDAADAAERSGAR
jgi:hypothetical protein